VHEIKAHWREVVETLIDPLFLYHFSYVACAFLGVIYLPRAPYFFAFHLLAIVVRSNLLKHVIASVTLNGRAIILTVR